MRYYYYTRGPGTNLCTGGFWLAPSPIGGGPVQGRVQPEGGATGGWIASLTPDWGVIREGRSDRRWGKPRRGGYGRLGEGLVRAIVGPICHHSVHRRDWSFQSF